MPGAERLGDLTPDRSMNRHGELAKELLHGFIFGKTFESGPALGVGLGSSSLQSSFRVVRPVRRLVESRTLRDVSEMCIQTSDSEADVVAGSSPGKPRETRRSDIGAGHTARINQLRKSSLTPSQVRNPGRHVTQQQDLQALRRRQHPVADENALLSAQSGFSGCFAEQIRIGMARCRTSDIFERHFDRKTAHRLPSGSRVFDGPSGASVPAAPGWLNTTGLLVTASARCLYPRSRLELHARTGYPRPVAGVRPVRGGIEVPCGTSRHSATPGANNHS